METCPQKIDVFGIQDRRKAGKPRPWIVRWRVDGKMVSRSFRTRVEGDRFRSLLVQAVTAGDAFDGESCEPLAWAAAARSCPACRILDRFRMGPSMAGGAVAGVAAPDPPFRHRGDLPVRAARRRRRCPCAAVGTAFVSGCCSRPQFGTERHRSVRSVACPVRTEAHRSHQGEPGRRGPAVGTGRRRHPTRRQDRGPAPNRGTVVRPARRTARPPSRRSVASRREGTSGSENQPEVE